LLVSGGLHPADTSGEEVCNQLILPGREQNDCNLLFYLITKKVFEAPKMFLENSGGNCPVSPPVIAGLYISKTIDFQIRRN